MPRSSCWPEGITHGTFSLWMSAISAPFALASGSASEYCPRTCDVVDRLGASAELREKLTQTGSG